MAAFCKYLLSLACWDDGQFGVCTWAPRHCGNGVFGTKGGGLFKFQTPPSPSPSPSRPPQSFRTRLSPI